MVTMTHESLSLEECAPAAAIEAKRLIIFQNQGIEQCIGLTSCQISFLDILVLRGPRERSR